MEEMKEELATLGAIIDMPIEHFEEELIRQQVNIGTMNNLILSLSSVYHELKGRKDAVLNLVFEGKMSADDPQVEKSLNGLYAEMTKIEGKVLFLKDKVSSMIDVG